MYYDSDGNELTVEQITIAVREERAVLLWSHGEWKNIASLKIYSTPKEAALEAERDTRGECYSMAEEVWCELATSPDDALRAAKGLLSIS